MSLWNTVEKVSPLRIWLHAYGFGCGYVLKKMRKPCAQGSRGGKHDFLEIVMNLLGSGVAMGAILFEATQNDVGEGGIDAVPKRFGSSDYDSQADFIAPPAGER